MKKLSLLAVLLGFNIALGACSDDETPDVKNELFQLPEKAYVLAEQFRRAIVIRDAVTQHNIWSWDPYTACVPAAQQGWFVNPSEVKPVFNRRYILMTTKLKLHSLTITIPKISVLLLPLKNFLI